MVLQTYENENNMLKRAKELNEGLREVYLPFSALRRPLFHSSELTEAVLEALQHSRGTVSFAPCMQCVLIPERYDAAWLAGEDKG